MSELLVFYNASCPVCRTEIDHYRRIVDKNQLNIQFEDISANHASCPLNQESMLKRLHVRSDDGMHIGAEAFIRLWALMPGYRWLAKIMSLTPLQWLFTKIYDHILAPGLYAWHKRRSRRLRV